MRKSKFIGVISLFMTTLFACSDQDQNNNVIEISNKQKATALLKGMQTRDKASGNYIHPTQFIQHDLNIADGIAGYNIFLSQLPASTMVNTVRIFQDGDFVITHTDYNLSGAKIGFDVFRFENGKIVEHWNNLQTKATAPNPSGRTMIDGETEIKDIDKTEANKILVKTFVQEILLEGKTDKLPGFFNGDHYIQHNPFIGDGYQGLLKFITNSQNAGTFPTYKSIFKVLGEGNFVLTMSQGINSGVGRAYYDLFRVENGKIAEHWDVLENIPPENTWKNKNGKF